MLQLYILLINVIQACSVTAGNYTYDLTYLDTIGEDGIVSITPPSEEPGITFKAAFCSDKISCLDQTGILYRNDSLYGCTLYAMWDVNVMYVKTSNGFTASYISNMICPETFEPAQSTFYYWCDESAGHLGKISARKPESNTCVYDVDVYTDLVCNGSTPVPKPRPSSVFNADGLSGGSIFLISLLSVLCVYLLVGFGVKYKKEKVFEHAHRGFWCWYLPLWTTVGCITSWRWVKSLYRGCCKKVFKTKETDERMATGLMEDQDK